MYNTPGMRLAYRGYLQCTPIPGCPSVRVIVHLPAKKDRECLSQNAGRAQRFGQRIATCADLDKKGTRRFVLVEALGAQIEVPTQAGCRAVQKCLDFQRICEIFLPVRVPTTSISSAQASPSASAVSATGFPSASSAASRWISSTI